MKLGIIDYGSGNLHSVEHALAHACSDLQGSCSIARITSADALRHCDQIVLPGVGHFADCRQRLLAVDGLIDALYETAIKHARPFLGICVGMQLLADEGHEGQVTPGLGWIGGSVRALSRTSSQKDTLDLKIPHMGWNTLCMNKPHPILSGIDDGTQVYFVHSYYFDAAAPSMVIATTDYGAEVPAVVGRDNLFGTQFHPEKSQVAGQRILRQFLSWRP